MIEYEVQGNYGYGHGYEAVTSEDTLAEAKARRMNLEYRFGFVKSKFRISLGAARRALERLLSAFFWKALTSKAKRSSWS